MADAVRLLVSIFTADLLPVFLIAGIGFLLARYAGANVTGLSRATLYGLAPCLIFNLLVTSTMSGSEFGRMALLCLMVMGTMGLLARVVAIPLRLERRALSAFLLVVMFSNGGNYGLPVALFAFGQPALAFATVYFVTSSVMTYTVGLSLAAGSARSVRGALLRVARVPAVYAVIAAGLVLSLGTAVPAPVMTAVGMLSNAALPVMILVLGMQLERAVRPRRPALVAAAATLSLVVGPLVGLTAAHILGLTGSALQAGVIQASMPTAVVTTVLALEFDAEPDFVTSVVVASTALSPFTVTIVIAYLLRFS